jgi:hypothetical protein
MKIKFLISMTYLFLLIFTSCTSDEKTDTRHNDAQMNDNLFEDPASDTLNSGANAARSDNVKTEDQ